MPTAFIQISIIYIFSYLSYTIYLQRFSRVLSHIDTKVNSEYTITTVQNCNKLKITECFQLQFDVQSLNYFLFELLFLLI